MVGTTTLGGLDKTAETRPNRGSAAGNVFEHSLETLERAACVVLSETQSCS